MSETSVATTVLITATCSLSYMRQFIFLPSHVSAHMNALIQIINTSLTVEVSHIKKMY